MSCRKSVVQRSSIYDRFDGLCANPMCRRQIVYIFRCTWLNNLLKMDTNEKFWAEFIEIYHNQPCLWDVKSKEYLNKQKRNASYNILLEKLKEIKADATIEFKMNGK